MALTPFPIDPHLTGIAIAYRNEAFIAESVLPSLPVSKQEFRWNKHALGDGFSLPSTLVGRKGEPNKVEFAVTETAGLTKDYGLDDDIPLADVQNADARYNPIDYAVMRTTELIELDREQRVATAVFNAASYPAANKSTLSGTSQWSDFTNSDPIGAIMDLALENNSVYMRPNIAVMGSEVWQKLSRHPKILEAVKSTGGAIVNGIASRQAVAQLFELEELLIGKARLNSAKKGQAVTLTRAWGKHALFAYRNRLATPQAGLTFGFTARWGTRIAGQEQRTDIGLRGGVRVRVGESVEEIIAANDVAYLFTNAVA